LILFAINTLFSKYKERWRIYVSYGPLYPDCYETGNCLSVLHWWPVF